MTPACVCRSRSYSDLSLLSLTWTLTWTFLNFRAGFRGPTVATELKLETYKSQFNQNINVWHWDAGRPSGSQIQRLNIDWYFNMVRIDWISRNWILIPVLNELTLLVILVILSLKRFAHIRHWWVWIKPFHLDGRHHDKPLLRVELPVWQGTRDQHHEVSTESQLLDGKAGVQVPPCQVIGAVAGGTRVALSDGIMRVVPHICYTDHFRPALLLICLHLILVHFEL